MPSRRPNEISAGGVLVRATASGWQVALIRAGRHWGLPKGNVEAGETAAQAALREVAEECGLARESLRLRDQLPGSDYVYSRDSRLIFKHVDHFLVEAPPTAELTPQPAEVEEAEWLDFEEAIRRASFKDAVTALSRARELLSHA